MVHVLQNIIISAEYLFASIVTTWDALWRIYSLLCQRILMNALCITIEDQPSIGIASWRIYMLCHRSTVCCLIHTIITSDYMIEASDSRSSVDYIPWRSMPFAWRTLCQWIMNTDQLYMYYLTTVGLPTAMSYQLWIYTSPLWLLSPDGFTVSHGLSTVICAVEIDRSTVVCLWIICCLLHCNQGELPGENCWLGISICIR